MSTAESLKRTASALLLSLVVMSAVAREAPERIPPLVIPGSCPRINYDFQRLKEPTLVDIYYSVSSQGEMSSPSILSPSSDPVLDSAVLEMLKGCKFAPALVAGKASDGTARHMYRASPSRPRLASEPTVADLTACRPTRADYPIESIRANEAGTTVVQFSVDENAKLTNVIVVKSSGFPRLDEATVAAVRSCTFRAGRTVDGRPSGGTFSVEYVWRIE